MSSLTLDGTVIQWWVPELGEREKQLVAEVIDGNFPNDGEYTTAFESRIAEICGVPYAVATTSGTTAIFLALAACGIGPGDEVLVPDLTFVATANAVRLTGATPVLVDVSPETCNIDPAQAQARITSRTRAIVPVHVSGRGADMQALAAIAARHGLRVVEDAAEALGSCMGQQPLGSFGDAGCFSFSPNKTITTGQGGMVVTRDEVLHARLRELKDHGRPVRGTGGADEHASLGYNFKLTNVQAAIGLAQLERFESRRAHLRDLYRWYSGSLAGVLGVRLPGFDLDGGACPQWIDAIVDRRDSLHDYLLERRIQTRKFWYPVHTHAPYREDGALFHGSTHVSARGLWLPSALSLTAADVSRVSAHIRDWAREPQNT